MSGEKGLVFAHRGGSFERDENTLLAFRESYEVAVHTWKAAHMTGRGGIS